jgi:hypothetical protein
MSGASATEPGPRSAGAGRLDELTSSGRAHPACFGATLVLTATLAIACFLALMSLVLLVVHPVVPGTGLLANVVNQQNHDAKTWLYVVAFAVILPLALILAPRLGDAIAAGPNGAALPVLVGSLWAALAATIVAVRISHGLPWGDGLGVVLAGVGAWWALASIALTRAARGVPWLPLLRISRSSRAIWAASAVLLFGAILCVTNLRSLSAIPLALGAFAILGVVAAHGRLVLPRPPRPLGAAVDVCVIVLLLLAIPDTVIFRTSSAIPNTFFEPGIIQFQQDWILGPTNQLLGGGALLVNSPVSQYGVGLVYFLAGWFHLAPIGYGTFGFLDGILTALFYAAGYGVLRLAGASRMLATAALAVAVVTFVYNLHYAVGALPEQGPLRFGMPMALILALVIATRWPRHALLARAAALTVLAISSIWALEAFTYTATTFAAITAIEGALGAPGTRRRLIITQGALGIAACASAHLILATATLAATGQLPDWGKYFAYLQALLLGGIEGSITYGFDHWSPGLAVGAIGLVSAAAIVLLVLRAPAIARRERVSLVALAGTTAYSIAVFSYADNRSATYLLLYIALPTLLACALWLRLLLSSESKVGRPSRAGGLSFCLGVVVILIAAAWPAAGTRFSRSALAHAYPGGGLRRALHRLWHPPPIDPRAPEGVRLLARYLPGRRALVLLPSAEGQDLSVEILMRSKRANRLFIGFGDMDSFVPSVWIPIIRRQLQELRPGDRLLIDRTAQAIVATLRANPSIDPIAHPVDNGAAQEEWILRQIDERFQMRPIYEDHDGFVVAELMSRAG